MLPTPQLLNKVENFIKERGKRSYYCLFLLGKNSGLRVSEAVNFDLSLKKSKNLYLIQGKRHKKRAVFIEPQVIETLKENAWKPQQTNRFSYAHFLQKTKQELNISANIELTPHTLRRCFATYQANSGMPLSVLQQVLGHSSIRTTALYWKNSDDPQEEIISDKWLAGKLPKKPVKLIENKPQKTPKFPEKEKNWKIFLNIRQEFNLFIENKTRNSEQDFLIAENKILQAKNQDLTDELIKHDKIITDLKNNLEKAEKLLKQTQNEKETLLKLLSTELQNQHKNLLQQENKKQNNQKLHDQLIAQIKISLKN